MCCDKCAEAGKTRLAVERQEANNARFRGLIPTEFIVWDTRLGNNPGLARARSAFSISNRKGVILHGTSGTGKTRILYQLVKFVCEQPEAFSWCVLDAFEAADKGIPKEAYTCDFLFIDDLGNEPKSPKFETTLLHLIRRRNDWHRPTSITTQLTPSAFKQRFCSGAAAEAIMRRFRERSVSVATDVATLMPTSAA